MTTVRIASRSVCAAVLLVAGVVGAAWLTPVQADWGPCMSADKRYSPTGRIDGALHRSAAEGATDDVEKLLDAGANPNIANSYGYAPLHVAAFVGETAIVKALLKARAEPNIQPVKAAASERILKHCSGFRPLHFAGRNGHTDIVDALLAAGAKPNLEANDGTTAIHWADKAGHVDAVLSLLAAGAAHK